MRNSKIILFNVSILILVCLIFSPITNADNHGGTFRFAMVDEPPALDQHVITSDLATSISQHMFEGLFTFNEEYSPIPMLAEDFDVSENGELVTIYLREGVLFHDGSEMTAEDVVASLNRWGEYGVRGSVLFQHIDSLEIVDDYTVNLHFTRTFAPWKALLAFINGGPTIHPKSIMDEAGSSPIDPEDYIGTGPYEFEEWQPGRFIRFTRFNDYVERKDDPDGYGGERIAYFDEIRFIPVPDSMTRIYGIAAGDYDYSEQIPSDMFGSANDNPELDVYVVSPPAHGLIFFNSKEGIMNDNYVLRQAIQSALDQTQSLQAAFGPEELWNANGSLFPPGTEWYSEAGVENWGQGDVERAQELAEEAGYDGETIRFAATTSYDHHYDQALVITDQLNNAGFNVELEVFDWATLVEVRAESSEWDMFFTTHGFVPEPSLHTSLSVSYPGWWDTPEREELISKFTSTIDSEERHEVWDELHELYFEQVPVIKTGDGHVFHIAKTNVKGLPENAPLWPYFWNASFE